MLNLTATELQRFMGCNAYQSIEGVATDYTDEGRDEGDAAHWFVEQVFKGLSTSQQLVDKQAPNGVFITPDMADHCDRYLRDITRHPFCGVVEDDTSYGVPGVYQITGRADHIYFDNVALIVDDFKYGWKIVEPDFNWTLISHAIGFLLRNPHIKPDHIVFRIYQPRPFHPRGNVREWSASYHDLMHVYMQKLHQTLCNPSDRVCTGEHCYRCPAMMNCPAAQIAAMNSIDVAEKAFNSKMSNEALSAFLDDLRRGKDVLKQTLDAAEELAMHRMKEGQNIPEYTAEHGLGQTRWKPGVTPEVVQLVTGKDVSKKTLITPTQAKNLGVSETVMKTFTERPNTGYKLVRSEAGKIAQDLFRSKL